MATKRIYCLPLENNCIAFAATDIESAVRVARSHPVVRAGECGCQGAILPVYEKLGDDDNYYHVCNQCLRVRRVDKEKWRNDG